MTVCLSVCRYLRGHFAECQTDARLQQQHTDGQLQQRLQTDGQLQQQLQTGRRLQQQRQPVMYKLKDYPASADIRQKLRRHYAVSGSWFGCPAARTGAAFAMDDSCHKRRRLELTSPCRCAVLLRPACRTFCQHFLCAATQSLAWALTASTWRPPCCRVTTALIWVGAQQQWQQQFELSFFSALLPLTMPRPPLRAEAAACRPAPS